MIQDYLQSRLVYYLTNLHIKPRSIWLSRHGESEFNLSGQIGGDADLSERGERYAKLLPELVKQSGLPKDAPLTIWTSTLKRTSQTAKYLVEELGWEKLQWKALDELDSGVCDAMTVSILSFVASRSDHLTIGIVSRDRRSISRGFPSPR